MKVVVSARGRYGRWAIMRLLHRNPHALDSLFDAISYAACMVHAFTE